MIRFFVQPMEELCSRILNTTGNANANANHEVHDSNSHPGSARRKIPALRGYIKAVL